MNDSERQRLLAEVRALRGASLQKLWLPSAQLCVLQLRVPGRTELVVLDARLSMAAIAPARPTAPDSAPRSQATLRNALSGTLIDARLEHPSEARGVAVRLSFPDRALIAEAGALLLVAADGRIVWASSGAARRPGSIYPEARAVELVETAPLPERAAMVAQAMQSEEQAGVAARRRELLARVKARLVKARRTLAAVEQDAARAASAEGDRARAELLLPHASRIPRGAREARVPDWSQLSEDGQPREVVLKLDPALSAAENAARWLRKAKRYGAALQRIEQRRAQVAAEVRRFEELLVEENLAVIEAQLGPARSQTQRASRSEAPRLPYRVFRSGAAQLLVGRSAKDNDALTFRVARGNDLWLHVRGVQGSHVILPAPGDAPDARVLGDAALLAAHFSSARGQSGVEVSWTRVKYVRKAGAPGAVTYSQEKTLRVALDEERLRTLLASEDLRSA